MNDDEDPSRGPIWNIYINGHLEDWMEIMRQNRIICKEDAIIWRYHLRKVDSSGKLIHPVVTTSAANNAELKEKIKGRIMTMGGPTLIERGIVFREEEQPKSP